MTIEEIGKAIARKRKTKYRTQRLFAKDCKIDSNVVRRLELGIYVNISSLEAMCEKLGLEIQIVEKQN